MENVVKTTNTVIGELVEKDDTYAPGTSFTILTADATDERRIGGISVSSSSTAISQCTLYIYDGATRVPLVTKEISITAGTVKDIPAIDLLDSQNILMKEVDNAGNQFFNMPNGTWALECELSAAPTAGKYIWFAVQGAKYDD